MPLFGYLCRLGVNNMKAKNQVDTALVGISTAIGLSLGASGATGDSERLENSINQEVDNEDIINA